MSAWSRAAAVKVALGVGGGDRTCEAAALGALLVGLSAGTVGAVVAGAAGSIFAAALLLLTRYLAGFITVRLRIGRSAAVAAEKSEPLLTPEMKSSALEDEISGLKSRLSILEAENDTLTKLLRSLLP